MAIESVALPKLPLDTIPEARFYIPATGPATRPRRTLNHGDHAIDLRLSILFDSDFADLFEVRGLHRTKHGQVGHAFKAGRSVLTYGGLDGKQRQTALNFDPQPTEVSATSAAYAMHLPPKAAKALFLTIGCGSPAPPRPVPFLRGLRK